MELERPFLPQISLGSSPMHLSSLLQSQELGTGFGVAHDLIARIGFVQKREGTKSFSPNPREEEKMVTHMKTSSADFGEKNFGIASPRPWPLLLQGADKTLFSSLMHSPSLEKNGSFSPVNVLSPSPHHYKSGSFLDPLSPSPCCGNTINTTPVSHCNVIFDSMTNTSYSHLPNAQLVGEQSNSQLFPLSTPLSSLASTHIPRTTSNSQLNQKCVGKRTTARLVLSQSISTNSLNVYNVNARQSTKTLIPVDPTDNANRNNDF
jgi:hypothetical protein